MRRQEASPRYQQVRAQIDELLQRLLKRMESELPDLRVLESLSVLAKVERGDAAYVLVRVSVRDHRELTPRQQEVVRLAGEGLGNSAIARRLNISGATVAAHLRQVFERLGVESRTELARYSILVN